MTNFKHIEGTGKPLKVVAPINIDGLVENKEYAVNARYLLNGDFWSFDFTDDKAGLFICLEKHCPHLNGGNWIVTQRES